MVTWLGTERPRLPSPASAAADRPTATPAGTVSNEPQATDPAVPEAVASPDAAPADEPPPPPARVRRATVLAVLVCLGVVGVLALAPVAALTASRLPEPLVAARLRLPAGELEATTRIRAVPVGLPEGTVISTVEDLRPYAVQALGPAPGQSLLDLLSFLESPPEGVYPSVSPVGYDYPYHYAQVDEVLDGVPQARVEEGGAALGAALTLFAVDPDLPDLVADGAARAGFAVLDRARSGGGCDAQLNLLTLVASGVEIDGDVVRREAATAMRTCPDDPTPGWLEAQHVLQNLSGDSDGTRIEGFRMRQLEAADDVANDFARRFPSDPGALATLGDMYLAKGKFLSLAQPFTSRRAFEDAATVFARVQTAAESTAGRIGAARAQLGLSRPEPAARLAAAVAESSPRPGRALQLAVSAQERGHHFDTASTLARRLAGLGAAAFPERTSLIPLGPPLSLGTDRLTPAEVALNDPGAGGGGVVVDEGFVPVSREVAGLTDTAQRCPEWVWRRDALLSGNAAAAAEGWPAEFVPAEPGTSPSDCPEGELLQRQVDAAVDGTLPTDVDTDEVREDVESLLDDRQNLLRWAGDLTGARREALVWAQHLGDDTALAHQRLGEIDYLRRDYDSAAARFAEAAVKWRILSATNDLAVQESQLARGAALLRAGRSDEAVAVLRPLVLQGAQGYGYQSTRDGGSFDAARGFATVSYYASTLLGDHELTSGRSRAAAEDFGAALLWSSTLGSEVHLDAAQNSAAIAALDTGATAQAVGLSRAAVAADPQSPVYLMTAAEVADRAGDATNAIRQGRAALASDPSDFPAANNVGVRLARQGHLEAASRVLRAAVDAQPGYALAWHNLGVVEGRRGPLHVVSSQGALGRAVALDAGFADRPPRVVLDTTTYRTGLDVSKPLPAGWSFAGSQRRAPVVTVGLLALALAGIGLVRLRDTSPSSAAKDWLDGVGSRLGRLRGVSRLRRPVWAVVATVGAFLLAFWRQPVWPWTGLAYVVGLVALVGAGMAVRAVVARRRSDGVANATWAPGVVVGLVSGAFGSPIAPMPVVRPRRRTAASRWRHRSPWPCSRWPSCSRPPCSTRR